jgi:putative FmdB family regulatory protein
MPIYEYQCTSCHHQFDMMQKVSDAPITVCPKCHHETVTKLISAAGFQLKGTGWYATDFKNKGSTSSTKESSSTDSSSTDSSSTTSTKGDTE